VPPPPIIPVVPIVAPASGLSPGDAISVAPSGIPVGATVDSGTTPSGEVAPIAGVVTVICAKEALPPISADNIAAINARDRCRVMEATMRPSVKVARVESFGCSPSVVSLALN
jgi:hypothetical protein